MWFYKYFKDTVEILEPVESWNAYGEYQPTYSSRLTIKGRLHNENRQKVARLGKDEVIYTDKLYINYIGDLEESEKISVNGYVYKIEGIYNPQYTDHHMKVYLTRFE